MRALCCSCANQTSRLKVTPRRSPHTQAAGSEVELECDPADVLMFSSRWPCKETLRGQASSSASFSPARFEKTLSQRKQTFKSGVNLKKEKKKKTQRGRWKPNTSAEEMILSCTDNQTRRPAKATRVAVVVLSSRHLSILPVLQLKAMKCTISFCSLLYTRTGEHFVLFG